MIFCLLPNIPLDPDAHMTRQEHFLFYAYDALFDRTRDALLETLRLVRLQYGDYVVYTIREILHTIPCVALTPCVHLLQAYYLSDSEVIAYANDIHSRLIPHVLRVPTSFFYLIRVVVPCGILAPLYSFMLAHRWQRAFPSLLYQYSSLFPYSFGDTATLT